MSCQSESRGEVQTSEPTGNQSQRKPETFVMPSGIPGVPDLVFERVDDASDDRVASYRSKGFDPSFWLNAKKRKKLKEKPS